MPILKLIYFDAPGRAEPVRVALTITGLPFEDHRVNYAQFMAMKEQGALPLGSVPVMEVDGVPMTQTGAMLRFVARFGGTDLYPTDPMEAFVVDSALETFNDTLSHALMPSLFERDMAKKLEMRVAFAAGPMVRAFQYVEGLIARSGGPFLVGARLSIADLVVAQQVLQILSGGLDGIAPEALEPFPGLRGLTDAYLADPRVIAHRNR